MTAPAITLSQPLYQFADEWLGIIQQLEETGGEWTPEIEADLAKIQGDFTAKVERCCLHVLNLRAASKALKEEMARVGQRAQRKDMAEESLVKYIRAQMERVQMPKVETTLITAKIVTNGGKPAVKWDGNPESIPEPYRISRTEVMHYLDRELAIKHAEEKKPLPVGLTVTRGQSLKIT